MKKTSMKVENFNQQGKQDAFSTKCVLVEGVLVFNFSIIYY